MGHYVAAIINRLRDVKTELGDAHEKYKMAEASDTKANAAAVEAKSKAEVAKTEVTHLKKVLEEARLRRRR